MKNLASGGLAGIEGEVKNPASGGFEGIKGEVTKLAFGETHKKNFTKQTLKNLSGQKESPSEYATLKNPNY